MTIKEARGLTPDQFGSADAYCEVFYGSKLVAKTEVQKETLNPVWNEVIEVMHRDAPAALTIELYDFSFMGKGFFLGSVEIPYQELLAPPFPTGELEVRLGQIRPSPTICNYIDIRLVFARASLFCLLIRAPLYRHIKTVVLIGASGVQERAPPAEAEDGRWHTAARVFSTVRG